MQGTITTRPERTSEEIAADRKEGIAFFARVYTGWIGRRDLERMIAYHSYAENLVQATMESESWWRSYSLSTHERKARAAELRALAEAEAARWVPVLEAFRQYVSTADRNLLPPPATHPWPESIRGIQERRKQVNQARSFFSVLDESVRIGSRRVDRIVREKDASFNFWLLTRPSYGPVRGEAAPEVYTLAKDARYRGPRQFHPAGLTPERAIEIATAVLDGGH
jgi:hypothetical protein